MLIGIVGLAGSGKDTVGNILCNANGHNFEKDSYARTLKDICSILFGWDRAMMEGDTEQSREWREQVDEWWAKELEIENFTPRLAMQLIGTDAIRNNFNLNMWLLTVKHRIENGGDRDVVICDCRFENEINMIKQLGGQIWRVKRGEDPSWFEVACRANKGDDSALNLMLYYYEIHPSEWAWAREDYDEIIENDSKLGDLREKVLNLLNK